MNTCVIRKSREGQSPGGILRNRTSVLMERVCYGMEFDPKYVDVIVQRWQGLSGKQAVLEGDGRGFEAIATERLEVAA